MLHFFEELTSTNDEAIKECYTHGDVIIAERQSAGRGQRGNKWLSGEGLNLTLTAILEPRMIAANQQFLVSQITALALCDMLRSYQISAHIKWTNDIYIGDQKVIGVLIENRVQRGHIAKSIIGIGINVNQTSFDESLPNPTSISLALGCEIERKEVTQRLYNALMKRFEQLSLKDFESIDNDYHALMYRFGERHLYRDANGNIIEGVIEGVRHSGELILRHDDDKCVAYQFKEVEFIIDAKEKRV